MIYFFEVDDLISLNESFANVPLEPIWMYVYKGTNNSLGFNVNAEGEEFVQEIISNAFTLILPDFYKIINKEDVKKRINNFRGISFYGNEEPLLKLHNEYLLYLKLKKKNILLERYNKETEKLIEPIIFNWFEDSKITNELIDFSKANNLEFIRWDWSNFGIHFYYLGKSFTIENRIDKVCKKIGVQLKKVNYFNGIPPTAQSL